MGTKRSREGHHDGGGKRAHYDQQQGVHPSRRSRFSDRPEDRDSESNTYRPNYERQMDRVPDRRRSMDTHRRSDNSFRGPDAVRTEPRKPRGRPLDISKSAPTAVNALKEKIRDLTRLLQRPEGLPADVRIEKERALAGYKQDLDAAYDEKAKQAMIKKYHMVRFFERQKATRSLKKLKKLLTATTPDTPEHAGLEKQIHEAQVDLNYALYYPLHEKYTSLYPRTAEQRAVETPKEIGGKGERKVGGERPPIWALVEKCMVDGRLEALRDGKLGGGSVGGNLVIGMGRPKPNVSPTGSKKEAEKPKKTGGTSGGGVKLKGGAVSDDGGDEDMSDGGFFEE